MKRLVSKFIFLMFVITAFAADDINFADFEEAGYGNWKVEGQAFGIGPAKGTLPNQMTVSGYKGKGLVNSYNGRDAAIGKLTSESFEVKRDYVTFLIGGGKFPGKTCMNLIIDGKVARTATGPNEKVGGTEELTLSYWDVREYRGQNAQIEIVDQHRGGWGHINVDNIVLTDAKPIIPPRPFELDMEFVVTDKYLILPIDNDGIGGKLNFYVDGELTLDYDIKLAASEEETDWYAFFSLENFKGEKAKVVATKALKEGFALVRQANTFPGNEIMYKELLRPQFHFTSKRGWLNDPNGMIYYKGLYHLFYQHNPTSIKWGNMTWGHATSPDMVHWTEQPKVLFPDAKTGMCYSGAAFIDIRNQLGKKTGDEEVIIAAYLRTKIGLCFAYSNDAGQTFTDYEGNPVITHEGARIDTPRPFFYEPTKRWVAPTYDFFTNENGEKRRCVGFYSSADLKDWRYESRVEQDGWGDELCGCVDFFQLPIDGDENNKKWVMIFIDGSYIIGDFDGKIFYTLAGKPAHTKDRNSSLVISGSYYATMTFENDPQGRRVQMTWMRGELPGMPFNQQMTLPSELTLHSSDNGPILKMNPIAELNSLRTDSHDWSRILLNESHPTLRIDGELFDVEVEFEVSKDSQTTFSLRGIEVVYDENSHTLSCDGKLHTKLEPVNGVIRLRMLLDRTSIEVYGNDGMVYMPLVVIPDKNDRSLAVTGSGGDIKINYLKIHELKSIWE